MPVAESKTSNCDVNDEVRYAPISVGCDLILVEVISRIHLQLVTFSVGEVPYSVLGAYPSCCVLAATRCYEKCMLYAVCTDSAVGPPTDSASK